ncbi:GDSL esterase/lipase-like [Forsythia ovata]|uniref:GDSL esterase/lipase-like n=1 Tax=Forsythia ovata TaxID=205694 RepID=A0ABD1XCX7_9LAMI
MVSKKFNTFSYLLLAIIASIFSHDVVATRIDLNPFCKTSETCDLCKMMVNGATNWHDAIGNAISATLSLAKELQSKSSLLAPAIANLSPTAKKSLQEICNESFQTVIDMLQEGRVALAAGDNGTLQTKLSAALDTKCADELSKFGATFPLAIMAKELSVKVSICLAISAQINLTGVDPSPKNGSFSMRPHQIVLFGDSITERSFQPGGWGAALTDTYSRKADVLLRGYSGYNTNMALPLLQRLFPVGYESPFVAATIFFGTNDAALLGRTGENKHVPIEVYTQNLRTFVQHFKNCSPKILIVLITPPPVDEQGRLEFERANNSAVELPDRTNEATGVYAQKCVELAKELELPSINLWSKMQETEGWQKKFLTDGLHLTQAGNAIVHEQVVNVFNQSGLSEKLSPH